MKIDHNEAIGLAFGVVIELLQTIVVLIGVAVWAFLLDWAWLWLAMPAWLGWRVWAWSRFAEWLETRHEEAP